MPVIKSKNKQQRCVSVGTFQRTWHELYQFITLRKPATHLGQTFSVKLGQGGQLFEEEKIETLKTY